MAGEAGPGAHHGTDYRDNPALDWRLFIRQLLRAVAQGEEVGVGDLLDHPGFRGLDHHAHGWRVADHAGPVAHSWRKSPEQHVVVVPVRHSLGLRRSDVRAGAALPGSVARPV